MKRIDPELLAYRMVQQVPDDVPLTDVVAACGVIMAYTLSGMPSDEAVVVFETVGEFIVDCLRLREPPANGSG